MFARILPLLLVLCTLLPAELRARMIESCRERDECCCQRKQAEAPTGPIARRVDCCESPRAAEHATSAAEIPARTELAEAAPVTSLSPPVVSAASRTIAPAAGRRGRDPPLRIHALTQHWLL